MKRRNFFGVAAGAVVAGPAMAQNAVKSLGIQSGLSGAILQGASGGSISGGIPASPQDHAKTMLAKLAGLTLEQRSKLKKRMHLDRLDPDIDSYKSISMSAKMDWQKERNLDARLTERKGMFERMISNVIGYDDEVENYF